MIATSKSKNANSVLGLTLDGSTIEGVVLRRSNGSATLGGSFREILTTDPLSQDPEVVGREFQKALEAHQIKERKCAVALPSQWLLIQQTQVPELPEEDLQSFLQLEAERGFPYSPDSLILAHTISKLSGGGCLALQIAAPRDRVERLEKVLRAARLEPITFSLALPEMAQAIASDPTQCSLDLFPSSEKIDLQVTRGKDVLSLRSLDLIHEGQGAAASIDLPTLLREMRVSLGALPESIRRETKTIRVLGGGDSGTLLASQLRGQVTGLGITKVDALSTPPPKPAAFTIPSSLPWTGALFMAIRGLNTGPKTLELLPPRVSAWQALAAKYSSAKLFYAAAAAGIVVGAIILAFLVQQIQLSRLHSQWTDIAPQVKELENLQQQIKRFRPWFDESQTTLRILRRVTETFPEDSSVTAKTIEIRDAGLVSCSGSARDTQTLMKTLDQLRASADVTDLQVDQLRGKSPTLFTFQFH